MKTPVSAVVLTYNNERILGRCLKSLKWCDEVIVIDNYSTDGTVKIASKGGVKVLQHRLHGNWSAQRNFGIKQAKHDWVLFVDSDEIVSADLQKEILRNLKNPTANGYLTPRLDKFLKATLHHGETGSIKLLRLANKKHGRWQRPVHEIWNVRGPIGRFSHPLIHDRDLSLSDFILRLDLYTGLEDFEFHWIDLLKPKVKFIVNYLFRLGFLDGFAGFIMAYFMSLNSIIVRVKSWEKQHRYPD